MVMVMVCDSVSTSAMRSSLAGMSTSRPSGVRSSNSVLMVLSSTALMVPMLRPLCSSMMLNPTICAHVSWSSSSGTSLRRKYTSQPVSSRASSCVLMSQKRTSAVSSLRNRYSSMKKGTRIPSTSRIRYSDSVRSKTSSLKWNSTSPFTPCGLPMRPIW